MIDENNDYATNSKLRITVKIRNKYNDRSKVAAKETDRLRDRETGKHLGSKTKKHTNAQAELQVDTKKVRNLIVGTKYIHIYVDR